MAPNTAKAVAEPPVPEPRQVPEPRTAAAADANLAASDYRYERKFFVSHLDRYQVESVVRHHPAFFREVYPPRVINNLYLDSFDDRAYFDNVEGLHDRLKVRIRWYGELFGPIPKPVLELKIKRGLVGRKESHRLAPFQLDQRLDRSDVTRLFEASELPALRRFELMVLRPALLNRYRRKYYLSVDGRVRLTLDNDLEFRGTHPRNSTFLACHRDTESTVVELKYASVDSDRVAWIASLFPFRMTRSSKYVSGRDMLDVW